MRYLYTYVWHFLLRFSFFCYQLLSLLYLRHGTGISLCISGLRRRVYISQVAWAAWIRLSMAVISGAARGGRGKLPPYGWTSKNYVICVCFHCHETSLYHTTNTSQGRRAKSHELIHRQYNRDWGTSYSRPPIHPYLTSPLLQNPGGATGSYCTYPTRHHCEFF